MTDEDRMDDVGAAETETEAEEQPDGRAAAQTIAALQGELATARRSLHEAQQQLSDARRRQQIDQLLSESEAVDLEAARLLTEVAVSQMDEPDVKAAVAELRSRKPYLFRQGRANGPAGAMSARRRRRGLAGDLSDAAAEAASSGDRRDLLRYLRMRREK